jgi:phosphoribosylanthranilate isomerase
MSSPPSLSLCETSSAPLWVKLCGIQSLADAQTCLSLHPTFTPNALGFIFVEQTPRYIAPEEVGRVIKALTDSLDSTLMQSLAMVGVFQHASLDVIVQAVKTSGITHVQLHAEEPLAFVKALRHALPPTVQILLVRSLMHPPILRELTAYVPYIQWVLLDWPKGHTAEPDWESPELLAWLTQWQQQWQRFHEQHPHFCGTLLAGKLRPAMLSKALALPAEGIDLASGIEVATSGVLQRSQKCPTLLAQVGAELLASNRG